MILYLIRHGESTYNAEGRIQGQADPELSPRGQQQGRAVAQWLAAEPIEVIYASPLRRARQTAELLALELGIEIRFDDRLKEVDAGKHTNRMRDEVKREFPNEISHWRSGKLDFVFPGGESRRELIRRGHEAMLAVAQTGHEHAAIVSHGGLLLAGLKAVLGIASEAKPRGMDNASITRLSVDKDNRAELLDFNSIEHLSDIASPSDG